MTPAEDDHREHPAADPTSSTPRGWIATWIREESFWREVTARALSVALVLSLVLAVGWAGGTTTGPVAYTAFALVVLGVAVVILRPAVRRLTRAEAGSGRLFRRTLLAAMVVLGVLTWVVLATRSPYGNGYTFIGM